MRGAVAVFNAGSSSIRFAVFAAPALEPLWRGRAEGIGHRRRFVVRDAAGQQLADERDADRGREFDHAAALARVLAWIDAACAGAGVELVAAGHRIVHGGRRFAAPALVTPEILARLQELTSLAPLHQPHNLAAVRTVAAARPGLPQIACFDTAFHVTQPPEARLIALPAALREGGIERYGFHGISYEHIASTLPRHLGAAADGKVIVAHLGNGASLCGMRGRRSVATTMGFSTLDGLAMGTRGGSIDPGVLLHLLRGGMSHADLEDLLYHRSGLIGISGISHDMRELLASPDPQAAAAVSYFVYRIAREIGSLAAAMDGLDALVFTAGIGENAPAIRLRVCEACRWLGLAPDEAANERGGPQISGPGRVSAWVIPTDEELTIAKAALGILS